MPSLKCSKSDPPIGAIIVAKVTNAPVKAEWCNDTSFEVEGVKLSTGASIIRLVVTLKTNRDSILNFV